MMDGQLSQDSLFQARIRTDFIPPNIWILAPVGSFTSWAIIAVGTIAIPTGIPTSGFAPWAIIAVGANAVPTGIGFLPSLLPTLELMGVLLSALTGYLAYRLVDRRNNHLGREEAILSSTLESVRSKTQPGDLKTLLPLSSAERNFAQLSQQSGERSAVLWGLMVTLPYVGWLALIYVLWFLSHDMEKHELREELFMQDLERALVAMGEQGVPRREKRSPFGNAAIYAALSLILLTVASYGALLAWFSTIPDLPTSSPTTPSLDSLLILISALVFLGIVLNGWFWQTMQGPIPHFTHHQQLEASLLKFQQPATSKAEGLL